MCIEIHFHPAGFGVVHINMVVNKGYFSTSFLAMSVEGMYQGCIMRNIRTKETSFKVPFSSETGIEEAAYHKDTASYIL